MSVEGDAVFYESTGGLVTQSAMLARRRMFELFIQEMRPSPADTLLDVGVSDFETTEANIIEKLYPYKGQITAVGIGGGAEFRRLHPMTQFVHVDIGAPLPFPDQAFDIGLSNAVLEHVGGADERRRFLLELARVSKRLFVTVPHRWFPVEHHTALPLLHYSPRAFRLFCRATGRRYWADPANLEFLDSASILREWPLKRHPRIVRTGLPLGPFASNLAIIT